MKKLTNFLLFTVISLTIASCANKGMTVATREDASINLSDYSSYEWIADVEKIPNSYSLIGSHGALIFNNQSAQKMIKDAVELQMKARGFSRDHTNPEMLINFTVLEEDTELRKYRLDNGRDYLGFGPRSNATQMVPVKPGTVLINFIDAKSGAQIWQGYASGALDPDDIKDMTATQQKVGAIFEDFDFAQFKPSQAMNNNR